MSEIMSEIISIPMNGLPANYMKIFAGMGLTVVGIERHPISPLPSGIHFSNPPAVKDENLLQIALSGGWKVKELDKTGRDRSDFEHNLDRQRFCLTDPNGYPRLVYELDTYLPMRKESNLYGSNREFSVSEILPRFKIGYPVSAQMSGIMVIDNQDVSTPVVKIETFTDKEANQFSQEIGGSICFEARASYQAAFDMHMPDHCNPLAYWNKVCGEQTEAVIGAFREIQQNMKLRVESAINGNFTVLFMPTAKGLAVEMFPIGNHDRLDRAWMRPQLKPQLQQPQLAS